MKRVIVLVSVTLLGLATTACVSTDDRMRSWVGKDESELLSQWGAPDSALQANDGKRILTWKTLSGEGGNLYTCRQSFTIGTDGKVERWSYAGCPAFYLQRPF